MTRTIAAIAVAALAVAPSALVGGEAAAKEAPEDILVGPHVVARVRVPTAGYTVPERANIVRSRVMTILSDASLTPDNIAKAVTIRKSSVNLALYVGKNLFFTVPPADAEAADAKLDRLAEIWANNLRAALPKIKPLATPESVS